MYNQITLLFSWNIVNQLYFNKKFFLKEREEQTPALSPFAIWGHGEKAAICKPREASGWNLVASTLILDFQRPELGEVSFCLSAAVLGVLSWQSGQNKTIMMTLTNTVEHLQCARHYFRKFKEIPGLLWPSSGEDPMLPMQGAQVWFLVRELRSHKPHGGVKKKNKPRNFCYDGVHILVNVLHDNMYAISIYLSIYHRYSKIVRW